VASIGGDFARRFTAYAWRRDLTSGVLAARLVRAFAMKADDEECEGVAEATRGVDQPVLSGLHYILDRALGAEATRADDLPDETPPAWAICAIGAGLWRE
jgi:hypothetical protein